MACRDVLLICIIVGKTPAVLAVDAGVLFLGHSRARGPGPVAYFRFSFC